MTVGSAADDRDRMKLRRGSRTYGDDIPGAIEQTARVAEVTGREMIDRERADAYGRQRPGAAIEHADVGFDAAGARAAEDDVAVAVAVEIDRAEHGRCTCRRDDLRVRDPIAAVVQHGQRRGIGRDDV